MKKIEEKISELATIVEQHLDKMNYEELYEIHQKLGSLCSLISDKMDEQPDSPSSILRDGIEWMKSEEGQKYIDSIEKVESHQYQRINNFFQKLTSEQLDMWIPKFLKWEEEYEEYQYTERFTQTTSNIFSILMNILKEAGSQHDVDDYEEDFLSDVFTWGDMTFKLYCGQGCVWRISDNDGKIIY